MNTSSAPASPEVLASPTPPAAAARPRRLRTVLALVWTWIVGAVFTQFILGAVLVTGWLQRWTRRAILRGWWRLSPHRHRPFTEAAVLVPEITDSIRMPNGFPGGSAADGRGGWRQLPGKVWGSLLENLRLGLPALINVFALTLPGATLMALGWWGGWQNSFHKGYEQAWVGPTVSLLGILLWIAAMTYVPLALARQAATERAREFWNWSTVTTLLRQAWLGLALLALTSAALNFGAMALKTWPAFSPQAWTAQRLRDASVDPLDPAAIQRALAPAPGQWDFNQLTDDQARTILRRHYLASGFIIVVMLAFLRTMAGRIYAGAVVRAVQSGALAEEHLAEEEWRVLHAFDLLQLRPARPRPRVLRWMAWAATRTGRLICATALFLAWFGFLAAVYISGFLNFHPVVQFLNQPLVQLPWFRFIPAHLNDPAPQLLATTLALLVLTPWAIRSRRPRR